MYNRRMPRIQVYLPDDLHKAVKKHGLSASKLLQEAVRADIDRLEALAETSRYLDEMHEHVGRPSAEDYARAEEMSQIIRRQESLPQAYGRAAVVF